MTLPEGQYYMHYVNHVENVVVAWLYLRELLIENNLLTDVELARINFLIPCHDSSKIEQEEWDPYVAYFNGPQPPNEKTKNAFKEAANLHKAKNLHHWESLRTYTGEDWRCYVVELVCDYIAMGWEFGDYILEYYERVKDEIDLPQPYKEYLESILSIIKEKLTIAEQPLTSAAAARVLFF